MVSCALFLFKRQEETKMRKSKMWRMLTVAAVAASRTCGMIGGQSVSADDKKSLKDAGES